MAVVLLYRSAFYGFFRFHAACEWCQKSHIKYCMCCIGHSRLPSAFLANNVCPCMLCVRVCICVCLLLVSCLITLGRGRLGRGPSRPIPSMSYSNIVVMHYSWPTEAATTWPKEEAKEQRLVGGWELVTFSL